jgi:hypothetical protein
MDEALRRSLQNEERRRLLEEEEERQLEAALAASLRERGTPTDGAESSGDAYGRRREALENAERGRLPAEERHQLDAALAASRADAAGAESSGDARRRWRELQGRDGDGAGPSTPARGKRKRELTSQMIDALAKKHRAVMEAGYAVNTSNFENKLGRAFRKDIAYKQIDTHRLNDGAAVPLVPDAQGLCRRKGYSLRVDYGLVLRPHQVKAVCLILRPSVRGMLLNYGMGVGKTLTAMACADNLLRTDPTYSSIVVICPAGVRDHFEATFAGTPIFGRGVPIRVLTWHAFGGATTEGQVIALCLGSILIIDEVHNGRNQKGQMASKATLACRAARKVILMSGTPVVNHPSDIGVILNMIRPSAVPSTRELFEGLFGESGLERHTDLLRGALRARC